MPYDRERLREQLIHHEGVRYEPYRDSVGVLTVGVGHNLEAVPLPHEVVMLLLDHDLADAEAELDALYPPWRELDEARAEVLLNMVFNLGRAGLSAFRRMWAAIEAGDYETAAAEMLDSRWARQVGRRAEELAEQMRTGTTD